MAAGCINHLTDGINLLCTADKTVAQLIEGRIPKLAALFDLYMDEIERFNPIYSLVKAANRNELVVKHILDSLAPLGLIASLLKKPLMELAGKNGLTNTIIADIGSGAGLPGIPLALCLAGVRVNLIERMGRRAAFLRNVTAILGLSQVTVVEKELEKTNTVYDLITLRAVSSLTPDFIGKLARLLHSPDPPGGRAQGGIIAAYKGRLETAKTELELLSNYDTELIPINVPFLNEERCLVLIKHDLSSLSLTC